MKASDCHFAFCCANMLLAQLNKAPVIQVCAFKSAGPAKVCVLSTFALGVFKICAMALWLANDGVSNTKSKRALSSSLSSCSARRPSPRFWKHLVTAIKLLWRSVPIKSKDATEPSSGKHKSKPTLGTMAEVFAGAVSLACRILSKCLAALAALACSMVPGVVSVWTSSRLFFLSFTCALTCALNLASPNGLPPLFNLLFLEGCVLGSGFSLLSSLSTSAANHFRRRLSKSEARGSERCDVPGRPGFGSLLLLAAMAPTRFDPVCLLPTSYYLVHVSGLSMVFPYSLTQKKLLEPYFLSPFLVLLVTRLFLFTSQIDQCASTECSNWKSSLYILLEKR